MTDSLPQFGLPTRSTDSLHRSYVRTDVQTHAEPHSPSGDNSPSVTHARTYGMCLWCRSIEVELLQVAGTRDFSDIGESAEYPTGYGCEVCS